MIPGLQPRRSLGLDMNYTSSASFESSGLGAEPWKGLQPELPSSTATTAAPEPRREAGTRPAAAVRLSKGQHHGFGFHSIMLKMSGLELVKHADWLQCGELFSVPKEALDKERWLHLLAAYDPDGSGEIPVNEVVADALQPVAVELITCLARTVSTLSHRVDELAARHDLEARGQAGRGAAAGAAHERRIEARGERASGVLILRLGCCCDSVDPFVALLGHPDAARSDASRSAASAARRTLEAPARGSRFPKDAFQMMHETPPKGTDAPCLLTGSRAWRRLAARRGFGAWRRVARARQVPTLNRSVPNP